MAKIVVTGGAGFIGSNFIHYLIKKYPKIEIINFDKLTYAGNLDNLKAIADRPNYTFVEGDIADEEAVAALLEKNEVEGIINFAAETHVDRSILEPQAFLKTDILGTQVLLEAVRKYKIGKFIQISTDEVYGDWENGGYARETDCVEPSSPYASSKAGADLLVKAYYRTYQVPVMITRCTNNYGPYQYPEKMLPLAITNLIEDEKVPVYGDGKQIRDWLYVDDHCSAIDLVYQKGEIGQIYNIGANQDPEVNNLDLIQKILKILGKDASFIEFVKDRPGHDRRYAVDREKIKKLGWRATVNLQDGLSRTISWYQDNEWWWKKIKSGEFLEYYRQQYSKD